MSCCCFMNRRKFMEVSLLASATASLSAAPSTFTNQKIEDWNPDKPLLEIGKKLVVQPVLMYTVSQPKPQSSYKSWGGIQTDEAANEEVVRITKELHSLQNRADFFVEIKPVLKVKTVTEAEKIHERNYDALILYPARGGGEFLQACVSKKKDNLLFVRKSSGPIYYWYEALSVRFLHTEHESKEETVQSNKFVHVQDVVVDDTDELLWRLRALYGIKNFVGTKIIALGGPWGKYSPEAPEVAQSKFNFSILDIPYSDIAKRINSARLNKNLLQKTKEWTKNYLDLPGTELKTEMKFVENCFILYSIFKDYMSEHQTKALTIRNCMNTIMPMSETTACLTLGLLNDEGYIAFCESDFVVIPPGVLLRHISGKPVFLHNSTFPHNGEVTCAHCIGPRRMGGIKYDPAIIMTHYESEYGAAPKVEMPVGQQVTFFDPEYSSNRWLGFKGIVKDNPFYEICRSQQDVKILGNWKKLINEVRDSHWIMAYGDYLKEGGYAARKLNINWENISEPIE